MGFFATFVQEIDKFFGVGAKNPPAVVSATTDAHAAPVPAKIITTVSPRAIVPGKNLRPTNLAGEQQAPVDPRYFAQAQQANIDAVAAYPDADSLSINNSFELQKAAVALQPFAMLPGGDAHISAMRPALGISSPVTTMAQRRLTPAVAATDQMDYVTGNIAEFAIPAVAASKIIGSGTRPPGDTLAMLSGHNRTTQVRPLLTISPLPLKDSLLTAVPNGDEKGTPAPAVLPTSLE